MSVLLIEAMLILVLLLANGLFAMSELAVVSARKARLQQRAEKGDVKAAAALELANAPERFLSTVQIGITLIGILAGAFGGATIAEALSTALKRFPWLAPYSDAFGLGIVVVIITYLSLVIGELVPKQIALSLPEAIAAAMAGPMNFLSRAAAPIVHFLSASTRLMLKVIGVGSPTGPSVTEEEVRVMIDEGTQTGTFEVAERDMIQNVLRLGDRRVSAIMTPRKDVVWLDIESTPGVIRQTIVGSTYSRFPVARTSLDTVLGIVQARDLLVQSMDGRTVSLESVLLQPLFISASTPVFKALELFKQHHTTIALVLDEYGGLEGLVTIHDMVASILGDVRQTHELEEPGAVQREDGSWLLDGMLPLDEFRRIFKLEDTLEVDSRTANTLAGFVLACVERIPTEGDQFEWKGLRFEVLDMDGNRIDKLLVTSTRSSLH